MTQTDEITKAIGAHGAWKTKLQNAIQAGRSDITPEQIAADNRCVFGQWLQSLSPAEQRSPDCQQVKALHAQFHREASVVLSLALEGRKEQALQSMGVGGGFSKASSNLTARMMAWKSKLSGA
jgi:hypothetical protein